METITTNHSTGSESRRELQSSNSTANIIFSLFLFILAGVFEIGGGYLVWRGIRDKYLPAVTLPVGSLVLIIYGFIPTLQPMDSFGRIFAVYGGFFILLSYIWGYLFDGLKLDLGDYIGTGVALAGVCIAWFWPRQIVV
jgi:drug/metabolite transporter superfamily protein YnfA